MKPSLDELERLAREAEMMPWERERTDVPFAARWKFAHAVQPEHVIALIADARRLDWLARQDFNELGFTLVQDAPHDGEYGVHTADGVAFGKTLRAAIDAAIDQTDAKDHP